MTTPMNDQKRAERKAQAMRMSVTKVKPVVVKHILNDQVMSIYDIKTHMEQQHVANLERDKKHAPLPQFLTGTSQGSGYKAATGEQMFYSRPEDENKQLLEKLREGMQGLAYLKENKNPNLEADAIANLNKLRGSHMVGPSFSAQKCYDATDGINYDTQSIQSNQVYNQSAIGEMNFDELDQLKAKNLKRIKEIEEKYFQSKNGIKTYKEVMTELKETWETKEQFKDSSLSYPSYGRGLKPNINMNTFMLQEGVTAQQKKKLAEEATGPGSPQASCQAQQRRRILSPRRQKFETQFERFMAEKYIATPIDNIPVKEQQLLEPPKFDVLTKAQGSQNVKVKLNSQLVEYQKEKQAEQGMQRMLPVIERDTLEYIEQEANVNLSNEWIENFRRCFMQSKEKGLESVDQVDREDFLVKIMEDPYFEKRIDQFIRESVDKEKETLDQILFRINTVHKPSTINWEQFLAFFTRRGKLRENEKMIFNYRDLNGSEEDQVEHTEKYPFLEDEDLETKQERLKRSLKEKLVYKQNMVSKTGKGKYDVTVPILFEFQKNPNERKSTRQIWLEEEVARNERDLQRHLTKQIKPTLVPKSTTQPLYQYFLRKEAKRRQRNREASMAKNKAQSVPFSFHERDTQKARQRALGNDDIDETMLNQFRARNIPWGILIPRFKMMMERDEHEREQRIRRNAESSFAASKLPPRMQAHVDEQRRKKENDLESSQASQQTEQLFSFQPARARSVPDFRGIQKAFITKMEQLKKSKNPTVPRPFKFSQARPSAHLRVFMDQQNQVINPTMSKSKRATSASHLGHRDQQTEQPATTQKHDAMVEKRREIMEKQKSEKEKTFQEEVERYIKQNRLQQRVKCSPALVSNSKSLSAMRQESIKRQKKELGELQKTYDQIKAQIEFNVANRPLLVEQVSKAFIHNLNQIKELQRYVSILREAGMNPDEHLTEEQRELLVSAEYYDRLNAATAYFPQNSQLRNSQADQGQQNAEEQDHGQQIQANQNQLLQQQQMIHEEDQDYDNENDDEGDQIVDEGHEVQVEQSDDEQNQMQDDEEVNDQEEGQEYENEGEDEEEMIEIDEEQLRQLLLQHQRIMNGEDAGDPIYDENGQPILLTQEEYEAALAQLQAQQEMM